MAERGTDSFYKQTRSRQKHNFGIYYIHKHAENIGALYNKDINDAANLFRIHRTYAFNTMKQEALQSWRKTISPINNQMVEVLNTIFSTGAKGYITEIDKEIQKSIENKLIEAEKIIDLQKQAAAKDFGVILNNKNTKKAIEELNQLIEVLAEGVKLLKSPLSGPLAIALLDAQKNKEAKTITGYSRNLLNALNSFKKNNQIVEDSDIEMAVKALVKICKNINTRKTKEGKGDNLTAKSLKRTTDYVFTTGLAENVVANGLNYATNKLEETIATVCGKTPGALQYEGAEKRTVATGKTDVSLSNVKLTLQHFLRGADLITDVGLSVKSYRTTNFQHNGKALPTTISSGSGSTLQAAFKAIFGNNEMANYFAYNTIAFRTNASVDKASFALNDLIIARRFNRLFMQRNKKDFSQILIVNGQVFSFWEIILSLAEPGSALLSSSKNTNQIVSLSIPDTMEVKNLNSRIAQEQVRENLVRYAWTRSKEVNSVINKAKVTAKIHLDNYYRALTKNSYK